MIIKRTPESIYKNRLRDLFGGWSCAYEPAPGSNTGYPDLQFLSDGILVPVEVKCGQIKMSRTAGEPFLLPAQIRPSQMRWHNDFLKAGGRAWVVVCMGPPREMDVYALPGTSREILMQHKTGYPLASCRQWVIKGTLGVSFRGLLMGGKHGRRQ